MFHCYHHFIIYGISSNIHLVIKSFLGACMNTNIKSEKWSLTLNIIDIHCIHSTFTQDQFATPTIELEVSQHVTLAEIYRGGLTRIEEINWLDPMRWGPVCPLHRDPFVRPTAAQLAIGWGVRGGVGGVRVVNVLNPAQTGFGPLSIEGLKELGTGPYLVNLARSYLTSYRVNAVQNQPYINLQGYHNSRRQGNIFMLGYVFDQLLPPGNWFGTWHGCQAPNRKYWEPVRIITIPKLTSRYKSNCDHTVVLAYVPDNLPVRNPTPGFTSPELHRVKMYICGPR